MIEHLVCTSKDSSWQKAHAAAVERALDHESPRVAAGAFAGAQMTDRGAVDRDA